MKQYLDLLKNILDNGREKESGRVNMPNTLGLSHGIIEMKNVEENFPLLTTKKMFWKGIVHELLWFLRGETNIKYLVDNKVNIWNGDAYRWYLKQAKDRNIEPQIKTIEEFVDIIKSMPIGGYEVWDSKYRLGDLGKIYGYQWRNQNGVDQISDIINDLKNNPYGRYKILDAWNKKDFPEMSLAPCHLLYQFIVRPMTHEEREEYSRSKSILNPSKNEWKWTEEQLDHYNVPKYYLDLNMYQRSCDVGLGVGFNLASMSLLLLIFTKTVNMVAGDAFWIGGDTHIYVNHIDGLKEQLKRESYPLPKMKINKELNSLDDIMNLTIDDFELIGYKSHPSIRLELSVGL